MSQSCYRYINPRGLLTTQPKGKSNPYFNGENIKSYHLTIGSYVYYLYNKIQIAQYKNRTYIYRLQNGYITVMLTERNKNI